MRRFVALLAVCVAVCATAADTGAEAPPIGTWDHLPTACYLDEVLPLVLRPIGGASGWSARLEPGAQSVPVEVTADAVTCAVSVALPTTARALHLAGNGRAIALRLVTPGTGAALVLGPDHRLHQAADPAVLVLNRVEATEDRRWHWLQKSDEGQPCRVRLAAPAVAWGDSPILAQIIASQALTLKGEGVLIELSGLDRLVAWKHRAFRQVVAWLVADCFARGAVRVVLAEPVAPAVEAKALTALLTQVRDVATSYKVTTIDCSALARESWWEIAPGVLGLTLNEAGRRERERLFAPMLALESLEKTK